MKVKLFAKNHPLGKKGQRQADLENEINAWLQSNPDIKVIAIKQSACGGSLEPPKWFVSVWYDEDA